MEAFVVVNDERDVHFTDFLENGDLNKKRFT